MAYSSSAQPICAAALAGSKTSRRLEKEVFASLLPLSGGLRSVVAVMCSIVLEVPNFALGGKAVGLYSEK
jgi:hypothetical protein